MKVIKLDAIDSTNSYMRSMLKEIELENELVVTSREQTRGKGQMGAEWRSNPGQSLTFSLFRRFDNIPAEYQFYINFAVSLGLKKVLEKLGVPKISIKWPNDIMSYSGKISGILIENLLEGDRLSASIIGIGLNVNETHFDRLPRASSMLLASGKRFNLDEVFERTVEAVFEELRQLKPATFHEVQQKYEQALFRKGKVSAFSATDNEKFNGIIQGISEHGRLVVQTEKELRTFQQKEVELLY